MVFEVGKKVALITGAATGIGLQYARELLKQGLKAVTIVDINASQGEKAAHELNNQVGKKVAMFIKADMTKSDEVKNAYRSSLDEWKSLDIVINNAGIMRDRVWEEEIALNCNGVVSSCLLAMEYMGKHRGGKGGIVVNASSLLGLKVFCGYPIYVGTKHFIVGMTRTFGQPFYYNLTGIKFMTICPGVTDTSLISELPDYPLENFDGLRAVLEEHNRTAKYQTVEHVAEGLYTMITKGENGSVWVSNEGEPIYEVSFPEGPVRKK
ncbi:hypothetical protein WA026_018995 [Henosepilachna vigintioctopunctata]|uniref:15-hydroxyprostaglandin dehydrogenase [NAD(+)]-like n=1 Tax=Henosepilachna vigintioctopunctata TaxID=420089 RepID=A0AAW1VI65_9CUCU